MARRDKLQMYDPLCIFSFMVNFTCVVFHCFRLWRKHMSVACFNNSPYLINRELKHQNKRRKNEWNLKSSIYYDSNFFQSEWISRNCYYDQKSVLWVQASIHSLYPSRNVMNEFYCLYEWVLVPHNKYRIVLWHFLCTLLLWGHKMLFILYQSLMSTSFPYKRTWSALPFTVTICR